MPAAVLDPITFLHDIVTDAAAPRGSGWAAFATTGSGGWTQFVTDWVIRAAVAGFKTHMVRAPGGVDGGASTIKLDDILRADDLGFTQLGVTGFASAFSTAKATYNLKLIAHIGGDLQELIVRVGSTNAYIRAQTVLTLLWNAGFRYISFDTGGNRLVGDPLWAWITATVLPMGFTVLVEPPPDNLTPVGAMAYGTYTIYSPDWQNYFNTPNAYDAQHHESLLQGPAFVQVPDGNVTSINVTAAYASQLNRQGASAVVPGYWILGLGKTYSDILALLGNTPFVQTATAVSGGNVDTVILGMATATGNTLIVDLVWQINSTAALADNFGNTYVPLTSASSTNSNVRTYYCINFVGGANHQITASISSIAPITMVATEYFGITGLLAQASGSANSNAVSLAALNPPVDELVVGLMVRESPSTTITPAAGLATRFVNTDFLQGRMVSAVDGNTGAVADPTWALGSSGQWAAVGATFQINRSDMRGSLTTSPAMTATFSTNPALSGALATS